MSNETDLDWLARNVHVWAHDHASTISYSTEFGAERYGDGLPYPKYTKDQWLSRRAELQNKPTEWPKRANWLAQHEDGEWTFYSDSADNPPQHRLDGNWYSDDVAVKCCHSGEVLGDWRDTLEKRPEEFQPFTSIEDNQDQVMTNHQDMKQDNGWHERGELPPVGTVCLYVVSDRLSAEVEITAHAKLGLCFVQVGQSGESYVSKTAELHRFRPIRTERDVLIEMLADMDGSPATAGKVADAILAAGFSLRAK